MLEGHSNYGGVGATVKAFGGGEGDSGGLEMRKPALALNAKYSQRMAALSGHGAPRQDAHSRPAPTRSLESPPRPVPRRRPAPAARPAGQGPPLAGLRSARRAPASSVFPLCLLSPFPSPSLPASPPSLTASLSPSQYGTHSALFSRRRALLPVPGRQSCPCGSFLFNLFRVIQVQKGEE